MAGRGEASLRAATAVLAHVVFSGGGLPARSMIALDVPDDCTRCGSCCFSERDDYIAVFAVDEARMDASTLQRTHLRAGRRFMRFSEGRCDALKREGDRLVCSIYAMRPDVCRWLLKDSGECRAQVAEKRERALVMLRTTRV
jgi:hypothetical protein